MTCVIARGGRRGWICADRRITSSTGERCANQRKVWRGPTGMIVAGAGMAGALGRIRRLVLAGCVETDLIKLCGDHTHVLCLLPSGKLLEVSEGDVWHQRGDHARLRCIGGGGDLARGYLEGRRVDEAAARAAQALAARLRDDCGGGVDFERL